MRILDGDGLRSGVGALGLVIVLVVALVVLGVWSTPVAQAPSTLRALYGLSPPRALRAPQTAVLLVDFQDEFVHGGLPLPAARAAIGRAAALAAWARRSSILVVRVHNVSARPDSPLFRRGAATTAFVPELAPQPGDLVLEKSMVGAFSRTNLDAELRARGVDTLIVGGFMTHLAVLSTATDATVLDYRVVVAADATATRALPGAGGEDGVDPAALQRAALAAMADRVADVMPGRAIMALPMQR